jgi:hypothetical protein
VSVSKPVAFNRGALTRLQAACLPHMTASGMFVIPETATPEEKTLAESHLAQVEEYLKQFVLSKDGKCICCGERQGVTDHTDWIRSALTGSAKFTYGIAHGEGFCSACHYPARANHYIGDWFKWQTILQYHPDGLSFDRKEAA